MCVNPALLNNGVEVGCRKCWQCRENKINDWVGRNIAEQKKAVAAHSITLTYGRDDEGNSDHVRSAVLTFSDVQKYFRSLRDAGYPCRYFVAGEYGSTKGRAHWHALVYWLKAVPADAVEYHEKNEYGTRFHQKNWPHGFSHWEEPSAKAIRYVCKYIQKDIGSDHRQGHVSMSKRPPLGAEYFDSLAQTYAEHGLSPQDPYYSFAGVNGKDGKKIRFFMKGPSLDNFIAAYLDYWVHLHPSKDWPHSDMIEDYLDRMTIPNTELRLEPLARRLVYPWREPPEGRIFFEERRNAYAALQKDGSVLYWSFDNEGNRSWQSVVRTENSPRSRPQGAQPEAYAAASARSSRRVASRLR